MFSTCEACGHQPTEHTQIHIESDVVQACVDSGIAELVERLWTSEIYTVGSCENHLWSGRCLVEFDEATDAETFLAVTLARATPDLRLRILEATDPPETESGEWGIQVSLSWLAEPGQLPLLRLCPMITFPQSDLDLVVRALSESYAASPDAADPVSLIVAATRGSVPAYYALRSVDEAMLERSLQETDWSRLLPSSSELRVLAARPAHVSTLSWLVALCAALAANRVWEAWEIATLDQYAAPLDDVIAWLVISAQHWEELLPPDTGSDEPLDRAIELEGDPRPLDQVSPAAYAVLQAMDAGDVVWTVQALEELRFRTLSQRDTLSHLVNSGWYPKGDPRSRHQRELERQRIESELTTDPRELLRKQSTASNWPLVVKLQPLSNGQLRLWAEATGQAREVHYHGNQRELVEMARDLLGLRFNAFVACRVLRDGPTRPLEVGFLPLDGGWEEVEAGAVRRGDILDRSVEYPAVVSDIHAGDQPDEIQFELNGMGWWTTQRTELLRRILPASLSPSG